MIMHDRAQDPETRRPWDPIAEISRATCAQNALAARKVVVATLQVDQVTGAQGGVNGGARRHEHTWGPVHTRAL